MPYNVRASTLEDLQENVYYRIADLQEILKNMGLSYSIYTIRNYETWKCLDYKCGKRHNEPVEACQRCGGEVRVPLIPSPRTPGAGRGVGHRRYSADDIREIVSIFEEQI